VTSKIAICSCS